MHLVSLAIGLGDELCWPWLAPLMLPLSQSASQLKSVERAASRHVCMALGLDSCATRQLLPLQTMCMAGKETSAVSQIWGLHALHSLLIASELRFGGQHCFLQGRVCYLSAPGHGRRWQKSVTPRRYLQPSKVQIAAGLQWICDHQCLCQVLVLCRWYLLINSLLILGWYDLADSG